MGGQRSDPSAVHGDRGETGERTSEVWTVLGILGSTDNRYATGKHAHEMYTPLNPTFIYRK